MDDGAAQMDDDALEEAFREAAAASTTSEPTSVPKKRTREDLLKALKSKRDESGTSSMDLDGPPDAKSLETAKQKGKFRPIGQPAPETKAKEEKRKKKKRKVALEAPEPKSTPSDANPVASATREESNPPKAGTPDHAVASTLVPEPSLGQSQLQPSPDPPILPPAPPQDDDDDDLDIFADVGEYEGVDLGDDSDDDGSAPKRNQDNELAASSDPPKRVNWFGETDPEPPAILSKPRPPTPPPAPEKEAGEEEEQPMRLAPLASSSIHDIKSFLDVDKALEKEEKRKARKEKNKKQQP